MSFQSEKEFNKENQDVLRTLDLAYFSEILKENEELKNTIKKLIKLINTIKEHRKKIELLNEDMNEL